MDKLEYLNTHVFVGLENLNNGFDGESIYYFSESDFEIVLDRVENLGLGIHGIEPWLNEAFYDVRVVELSNATADDPKWYRKAFSDFKKLEENLMYAASYSVPDDRLNE